MAGNPCFDHPRVGKMVYGRNSHNDRNGGYTFTEAGLAIATTERPAYQQQRSKLSTQYHSSKSSMGHLLES